MPRMTLFIIFQHGEGDLLIRGLLQFNAYFSEPEDVRVQWISEILV